MGWLPDYPDFRDYTPAHALIQPMLQMVYSSKNKGQLPITVDLKEFCSPVENQGRLGSCTAQAGVGLVEYFINRAVGKYIDVSRLFLYKVTRNLMHQKGDTGAFLRTTMGALVLFGVPPEEYWPYHEDDFDKEPPAFCYAFAQNYQAISYYRLDPPQINKEELLKSIKTNIVSGLPSMFGFTVFNSIQQADQTGCIPYPTAGEKMIGGHAMVAVGYDDKKEIKNSNPKSSPTIGALLIRNSWGTDWGEHGYGYLPYEYVLKGLAEDFWSILKNEWVETGIFKE